MKYEEKLIRGTLVKRYKRFFADVELADGSIVTAHCPNTGSMKTCGSAGDTVYIQPNANPKRKLKFTWELTKTKGGYIGVNTGRPNHIVFEAIESNIIPELTGYESHLQEKKYGKNSRIDILLESASKPQCFVEIKNTTLLHEGQLVFPDSVTSRGLKHIHELANEIKKGNRGVMFYLCNRPEGDLFSPAEHIDPEYAKALKTAYNKGLEILAYRVNHTLTGSRVGEKIAIKL